MQVWARANGSVGGVEWFRAHARAVVTVDALLFLGITLIGAGIGGTNAHEASMLYVLPIGLAAITFGVAGGCGAATVAAVLFAGWMAEAGTASAVTALGWASRLIAWFLLGALLGDASNRTMRSRELALVRQQQAAERQEHLRRHQEAVELNDTVVQGLAVAKWKIEAGDVDGGLALLTSTIAVVQELIADQIGSDTSPNYRSSLRSLRYGDHPPAA